MDSNVLDIAGTSDLNRMLSERVEAHPAREFLVFEDENETGLTWTYAQFGDQVNRLASGLVRKGVKPGDKVAVMLTNSPEFLVAWFAICQAGGVLVSVNVLYAPDELQYLINAADCVGFITEPKFVATYEKVAASCGRMSLKVLAKSAEKVGGFLLWEEMTSSSTGPLQVTLAPNAISQIIYTSGTTARPKGAMISHRSSITQGVATAMLFGMTTTERTCVVLPLFHVNAQYVGVIPTLTVGGTVVLLEAFSARRFWAQVRKHRCTTMSIVPMLLRTMLAQAPHEDDANHDVRLSFYALLTTDQEWDAFEQRFGVKLIEGYGLSETLGICTSNPAVHGKVKRHTIGLPLLGRQIRVLNAQGQTVPTDIVGRIQVRGEGLFSGYYKDEAATSACMSDGWFETGDNGFIDADGSLHFFERSKDVIKRAGENIAASEVERVLNEHPKILESAVIAVPDPLRDEAVKAFIVLKPGEELTGDEISAWCAARLAKFKVPAFYEFRGPLPRTSIGKILKYTLKSGSSGATQ